MNAKNKLITSISVLFLLWILVAIISIFTGSYELNPFKAIFSGDELSRTIYFRIRIPRVLMAAVAGGTLAIAGASLQALFRNPLAAPFTLGVSGGASLGALIAIRLGLGNTLLGFSSISIVSFIFSIFTILFVYSVSKVHGVVATGRLLLAGVVVNFLYSALILFIQFFSDFIQSLQTIRWIMGSLDIVELGTVWKTLLFATPGCIILLSVTKDMNLFALGDDVASSLGVNIGLMEKKIYFATSLAVSAVISVTGPIGFVGLIIPHVLRMIIGVDNRIILPCSFLLGASFLTAADTVSRTIFAPIEIPVGIITASCGGVFFLWLLMRMKKEVIV
ncbi:MAG: transport system permease, iron complex transport system permease protein [Candidatus Dadabacteria bacterium CSP1-2]|nr:MAG: transport system permease, iron complex transport system permease protein [Candidatus Dadabacteria bacterium CSP1-2]